MKAKPQMAEMQDPLSPQPHRPFESVPPYSTGHAQVHRPPHLPARHQSYSHPAATPLSPAEIDPSAVSTASDSGTWRPSVWLASSLQPASPETPILPSPRYSDSSESNTSLPSSRSSTSQYPSRSDGTRANNLPPKPTISRSFTCPSGHVPSFSNTHIASSTHVTSRLGSRIQQHSIPEESARTSPPLQHRGIPYTEFPPKGCNNSTIAPYPAATPPYPASRSSTTSIHPSQTRQSGPTRQATVPTPSSYPYRQQQQMQQQQQQQQRYSPNHPRAFNSTSPPLQSHAIPSQRPTRQSSQPPPSAAATAATPTYSHHHPKPPLIDYRRSSFPPVQTGVYRAYPIDVNAFTPPATAPATAAAATAAAAVPPFSPSSSSSSPPPRRKQTRFADDEQRSSFTPSDSTSTSTSFSSSCCSSGYSSSSSSDDENDYGGGGAGAAAADQRHCRRRGRRGRARPSEQVLRGKKGGGVKRAATPRPPPPRSSSSSSSLSLNDYDDDDDETETETETGPESVVEGHPRHRRHRHHQRRNSRGKGEGRRQRLMQESRRESAGGGGGGGGGGGELRTNGGEKDGREGRSRTQGMDAERKRDGLPGMMDLAAVFATYVLT